MSRLLEDLLPGRPDDRRDRRVLDAAIVRDGVELLAHRDVYKDQLFIPLELQFQLGAAASLKVLSGVSGQLSALGDTYQVPLGLGLIGNVSSHVDIGLRFSFDNLLGHVPAGGSHADSRSVGLLVNLRT